MKGSSVKRKLCGVLVILAVLFIWGQSVMPKTKSSEESHWVTENIVQPIIDAVCRVILPNAGSKFVIKENFVRKLAHMTEFFVTGFLMMLFAADKKKTGIVCILAFFVAFLDESVQVLSGRGPMITDVWVDMIGAAVGILLGWAVVVIRENRRRKGTEEGRC